VNSLIMISKSGRRWALGENSSDGSPTTREDAERIAAELGFTLLDPCGCGRPARGPVDEADGVPEHLCRQCSPACCAMASHLASQPVVPA
jgi:hypothetical protein